LRDFGIASDGGVVRRTIGIGGISRPLLLCLNNAFRRRQRLLLTLATLAVGGAIYLGAENLRVAVRGSVAGLFSSQRFDLVLRLSEPQAPEKIEAAVAETLGSARAEVWTGARAVSNDADGTPGESFPIVALPDDSKLFVPRLVGGRWLSAADQRALVVSRRLSKEDPRLVPGAEIALTIDGVAASWRIVGVVDSGLQTVAYAKRTTLVQARGFDRAATLVVAADRTPSATLALIQDLRGALDRAGMPVANSQLVAEARRVTEDHLLMVIDFLAVMAWVMIAVGGMGLASTMGLAVLERTREIGVLRAIGARHGAILWMIQIEGLVIALLSFAVSLPLSIPMSVALGEAFGRVMFPVPVIHLPDVGGAWRWLALLVVVSVLGCALPALHAMRVSAVKALAYE
jgi:putative ABC transport system permease protein